MDVDGDDLSEAEIRQMCHELSFAHLSDDMVARMRESRLGRPAKECREIVSFEIDPFLAFRMEKSVAESISYLRKRIHVSSSVLIGFSCCSSDLVVFFSLLSGRASRNRRGINQ